MRDQVSIPCLYMRGGTSKGPYFKAEDLPPDRAARDRVLLAVMGSPDLRQIDGLGGADTLTSKVAVIARSQRPGVDVDYHFCQVDIGKPIVDTSPPCGNMLAGVGPFAIEQGLVPARDGVTPVIIWDVNIGAKIEALVQTPGGDVVYGGDATIDGVPGSAAPVILNFLDVVGSKTGAMCPTGHAVDLIQGVEVSCLDVAMPMMDGARARPRAHRRREHAPNSKRSLKFWRASNRSVSKRAGGWASATSPIWLSRKSASCPQPRHCGVITSRYLTPHKLHAAHAVRGGVCVATACLLEGSVAYDLARRPEGEPKIMTIEHPSGVVELRFETEGRGQALRVIRAGVMRTTRPIMNGEV